MKNGELWARLAVLALAGAVLAPAQVALFTVEPGQQVANQFQMGSVPAGDSIEVRFRLKNTGQAAARITTLSIAGTGFSIPGAPVLPRTLAAGAWLDFTVRFDPGAVGAYSASLRADALSVILLAQATAAPVVTVEEGGGWRTLTSGMVVDFGAVERGASIERRLALSNRSAAAFAPLRVVLSGGAFALAGDAPAEVALAPGATVILLVRCTPTVAGIAESVLAVGGRSFTLRATAVEPAMPRPEIVLELPEPRSARQGRVAVRFGELSRARATGVVRLEFEPSLGLGADPAILFASGGREAAFQVEPGDTAARFGAAAYMGFQTGSTAGTVIFTVEAGGYRERRTVEIAPAPAGVGSVRAVRGASSVEVTINGFDNTRGISLLSFTFFDGSGVAVAPGAIRVEVAEAFRRYFAEGGAGGTFLLRAIFPVTGAAERIETVEVELVNAAGTARTGPVSFGY